MTSPSSFNGRFALRTSPLLLISKMKEEKKRDVDYVKLADKKIFDRH